MFIVLEFDGGGFWQIGRIPNEWARCLLPLVRDGKVRIEGHCKFAPDVLGIMDTIILSVRYAQCNTVFHKLQCCFIEFILKILWFTDTAYDGKKLNFALFQCIYQ